MNKKHKKKLKRAAKKKQHKQNIEKAKQALKNQMNMFERLPDRCTACEEPFPKTREAHLTWRVVVRNKEKLVRLFCPECQGKVKKAVEKYNNEI